MESKFKIGDKVIGNEKADYYRIMKAGYTGEVTKIFHNGLFQISGQLIVREECFDRAPSRQEIHITCTDGKTTHAVKKIDGKIVGRAKATCAPDDAFKFDEGAELAFNRLVYGTDYHPSEVALKHEQPKREPVKLYCVKDYEPGKWLTKGKVYTTDAENMLTFDDGFRDVCAGHGTTGFTGFIKRNPDWKNHLVPLVSRPAKVGEWVRNSETGEVCEVIALSFGKNTYVRTKVGNETYNGCCADRKIEHPFDLLDKTNYLVLDGHKPEPKYYNGKVVCTKDGLYHTAGRVYEIKDGVINDDSGVFNYNKDGPVKSISELNFMVFPKFIKFKGEQK